MGRSIVGADIASGLPEPITDGVPRHSEHPGQCGLRPLLGVTLAKLLGNMWMACYSLEEIGEAVGVTAKTVDNEIRECVNLETLPKLQKVSSSFSDADFDVPIYNVWAFGRIFAGLRRWPDTII